MTELPELMTSAEVRRYLRIGRWKLREMALHGDLRYVRFNDRGDRIYFRDSVLAYKARKEEHAG